MIHKKCLSAHSKNNQSVKLLVDSVLLLVFLGDFVVVWVFLLDGEAVVRRAVFVVFLVVVVVVVLVVVVVGLVVVVVVVADGVFNSSAFERINSITSG